MSKILLLDIETAPKVAYVWEFFKANISPKQVLDHGHIMSYAAKWLDSDDILYFENRKSNDKRIVKNLCALLDEADIVIAHNGKRFDLPMINARAVVHGLSPPSPYKIIDTLKAAKGSLKLERYSLEYLAQVLGCTPKLTKRKFPGFELWLECLRNNNEAWEELMEYNIQDVRTLEEVYIKLRPWIKNHPNVAIYKEHNKPSCTKCGSDHVHLRGYYYSSVGKFRRYKCLDCGSWNRTRNSQYPKDISKELMVNAN